MATSSNVPFDHSFYTEFRHEGTPEEVIADFAAATRLLLQRLISDLRSTEKGPFGLEDNTEYEQMAIAVERVVNHVDFFQEMASGRGVSPDMGRIVRNVVANVLADANAAEVARARANAPRANQAKFDQGKTGSSVEGMKEYADKIKDAGEGVAKIIDNNIMEGLFDILAAVLEDIAISGAQPADNTGGNEATRQIEEKLDEVMPTIDGIKTGQSDAANALSQIDTTTRRISAEVDNIEYKADRLGALLGQTLVGSPWVVHPTTATQVTPLISIKDEMHGIENDIVSIINTINITSNRLDILIINMNNMLNILIKLIQFFINIFPTWVFDFFNASITNVWTAPSEPKPLIDERLKKIFVYAEDQFAPQSANDQRTIDVRTPAFDLSGWIDLLDLRTGDIVEVSTFITIANRRRELNTERYDQPMLLAFADFARGHQYISGSDVQIQMRQTSSADNFATPVTLGYQFIVESQ